jgi:ribonuclease D
MLQFASRNNVVLFRLHQLEDEYYQMNPEAQEFALPKPLEQLLTSPLVRKVGVGLRDDAAKINAEFGIKCEGITDIADLPQTKRCKPQSLQGLTALFLGFYHDKSASKTNWEADQLSQRQILYAGMGILIHRL